jgi:hypothetical protein
MIASEPPLRITAYFDESQDGVQSHVFALAGWTAWNVEWGMFERKWNSVLAVHQVPELHMREYESSWGSFKGWEPDRKIPLLSALIDTFEQSAAPPSSGPVGFWSAVPLKDYERYVEGRPLKWEDDPAFLCFLYCLKRILPFTIGTPDEVQIDFVFDQKPELEQRMRAIFWQVQQLRDFAEFRHRFGTLQFASRRDSAALQAADLLAYECYKHTANAPTGFPRSQRKSLARLKSRIVHCEPLPAELLERVGIELDLYYKSLEAIGIPKSRIDTL